MKHLTMAMLLLATVAVSPRLSFAQQSNDAQYLASFRRYWQQLDRQLQMSGNDCNGLVVRLETWNARVEEDIDTLLVQSQGLTDRMTDPQMEALQPVLEPLLRKVADAGVACMGQPKFREVMRRVNRVLSMGG